MLATLTKRMQGVVQAGTIFLPIKHPTPHNGAILYVANIIKVLMSSAMKAELGAAYTNDRKAIYEKIILEELGHHQLCTQILVDDTTTKAGGI